MQLANVHRPQMTEILQSSIPYQIEWQARLPGIKPLDRDGWIICDEAFCAQMAERDRLIHDQQGDVFCDAGASPTAKREVLDMVLAILRKRQGYTVMPEAVRRPDGQVIRLEGDHLLCAAQLVQEDLCLHEKQGDGHVLTAGVMCFPASWTLSEKVGRGLPAVHGPVDSYDENVAKRVQRLFDGIQPDRPLWRHNALRYVTPDLYQPRTENAPRDHAADDKLGRYVRSEHQALVRLPKTGAVLFAIHTYVIKDK